MTFSWKSNSPVTIIYAHAPNKMVEKINVFNTTLIHAQAAYKFLVSDLIISAHFRLQQHKELEKLRIRTEILVIIEVAL